MKLNRIDPIYKVKFRNQKQVFPLRGTPGPLHFSESLPGQNPFSSSGMYTFLPFMEVSDGVYFPKGGIHKVAETLLSIAKEHGARLELKAPVLKIDVEGKRVKGVTLKDGSFHPADLVVANADLPYVYRELNPTVSEIREKVMEVAAAFYA